MKPHAIDMESLIEALGSDVSNGLKPDQVNQGLQKFGENKLREQKKKTMLQRFFAQFRDVMILILMVAALVSFVVAVYEGEAKGFFEPVVILLIVVLNAIMGVLQESKAEKALEALKSLSAPNARVMRNGEEQMIPAIELVPGDIIMLEAGDYVPADARLIESASLKSEESALTGESVPAEKDARAVVADKAPLGDRDNMVFSGCAISYGSAVAIVTATGMDTEMGKIANLLEGEGETQTPLQHKLANLGKVLGIVALGACAVIFVVGLLEGIPVLEIFMISVSLAVSAIPEGLPAIVTIVLSIGVQRMVKKNAVIRRLPAVETLGSASIICSDKTGTLTQNQMTMRKAYLDGAPDTEDMTDHNSDIVKKLLTYATLCCDATIVIQGDEVRHIGDPTETAIVYAAYRNGLDKDELNSIYPRIAELPFDSERKLMTTVHEMDGKIMVIVKGAFDVIAERCVSGDVEAARIQNERMSSNALRVLAVATKRIEAVPEEVTPENLEYELNLMGLLAMMDPPRPEAKDAVAVCRKAGIKPVMITGDHVATASAIARELGIFQEGDEAITGPELDEMTESQFKERVHNISVYARVSPENKIRIVHAWQQREQVVAMTGDGVNDAPALKAADIGCAMGITGTDVAKGAADMTLTDDNFTTIVDAIREGRGLYDNIRKVVGFLLGTNIGEILVMFFAMVLWHKAPLISMQLLWINLVTDSFPAIALGMEKVETNIMTRIPRPKNEGIFANGLGTRILLQGAMFAILTLIGFRIGEAVTGELEGGRTAAFLVLAVSQTLHSFNMRSNLSLFKIGFFSNTKLNGAALLSLALVAVVVFTPLSVAFGMIRLPVETYLIGFGLAIVPLFVMELAKAVGLIRQEDT